MTYVIAIVYAMLNALAFNVVIPLHALGMLLEQGVM